MVFWNDSMGKKRYSYCEKFNTLIYIGLFIFRFKIVFIVSWVVTKAHKQDNSASLDTVKRFIWCYITGLVSCHYRHLNLYHLTFPTVQAMLQYCVDDRDFPGIQILNQEKVSSPKNSSFIYKHDFYSIYLKPKIYSKKRWWYYLECSMSYSFVPQSKTYFRFHCYLLIWYKIRNIC